jgi:SAM-dependent methyltransferase
MNSEPSHVLVDRLLAELAASRPFTRAVLSGTARGQTNPFRRAELRPVELKGREHVQVTLLTETQAFTYNHPIDELDQVGERLSQAWANGHLEAGSDVLQLRLTKKGALLEHRASGAARASGTASRSHDRAKERLLPVDHPAYRALGVSDERGVKPSRADKVRQVEEFVRLLIHHIDDAARAGRLPRDRGLRLVDLGCGNAYLTFAAAAVFRERGISVERFLGVDIKEQARARNTSIAAELGYPEMVFAAAEIADADLDAALGGSVDVVLALHACDTATDEALIAAVTRNADYIAVVPCCQAELYRQLGDASMPEPWRLLWDHPLHRRDLARATRATETCTDAPAALALLLHRQRAGAGALDGAHGRLVHAGVPSG